jgi:hypothetical protein
MRQVMFSCDACGDQIAAGDERRMVLQSRERDICPTCMGALKALTEPAKRDQWLPIKDEHAAYLAAEAARLAAEDAERARLAAEAAEAAEIVDPA